MKKAKKRAKTSSKRRVKSKKSSRRVAAKSKTRKRTKTKRPTKSKKSSLPNTSKLKRVAKEAAVAAGVAALGTALSAMEGRHLEELTGKCERLEGTLGAGNCSMAGPVLLHEFANPAPGSLPARWRGFS